MESKAAALGSSDFVMPFSALGLDTFETGNDRNLIVEKAKKILEEGYALVVVADDAAEAAGEVFSSVQKNILPAVVVVPFTTESTGVATKSLGELLKTATGINILQKG
jgi:vacuolar-type H+-ATPase subunit F/Vma7